MNEHTKERYREKKRFKSIASDDWCFSNWAHSELRSSSLVTQKSGEKNALQDVRNFQPATGSLLKLLSYNNSLLIACNSVDALYQIKNWFEESSIIYTTDVCTEK